MGALSFDVISDYMNASRERLAPLVNPTKQKQNMPLIMVQTY